MANWVDQDLHIVGRKTDVDRFIRTGFTRQPGGDDVLHLHRLCPPTRRVERDPYRPAEAIVLSHLRTHTQALFSIQTRNVFPEAFYRALPVRWPELSFVASVNEDMGNFGGVVMVLGGEVTDLVRSYDGLRERAKSCLRKTKGTYRTDPRQQERRRRLGV